MANRKIYFPFLWLIIELITPILSVSLSRNEKDISVASLNTETLKMPVDGQLKFNGQSKIQGILTPDVVATHLDPFKKAKRSVSESENNIKIHPALDLVDDYLCQRHKFELNFAEIGLSWILHPEKVDIGVCKGSCKNALSVNGNIRNLAYEKGLISKQEAPCCVPTKLRPVRILYSDETDTVQSANMADMIIEECGCQ